MLLYIYWVRIAVVELPDMSISFCRTNKLSSFKLHVFHAEKLLTL